MEPATGLEPWAWTYRLGPVMTAIAASPSRVPRAVVVGNAGSGKTTLLHRVHDALIADGREATLVTRTSDDPGRLSAEHVLLVDDLPLQGPERIATIRLRAEDPDAALIVAGRPWPSPADWTTITRHIEHTGPAFVLGRASRAELFDEAQARGRPLSAACADRILEMTGGVSWIVAEAVDAHDERDCAGDASHGMLSRILDDRIAHRLDTVDDDVQRFVVAQSLFVPGPASTGSGTASDGELAVRAYAEGLLLRNGSPAPAVRSAVRSIASALTIASFAEEDGDARPLAFPADDVRDARLRERLHSPMLSVALTEQADHLLDAHPQHAGELYRAAWEAGDHSPGLRDRRARAAWSVGDLDEAAVLAESALEPGDETGAPPTPAAATPVADRLTDLAAAVWAARGMFAQSHAVYRSRPPRASDAATRAAVAALGAGIAEGVTAPLPSDGRDERPVAPSTLGTAMALLLRGMRATLGRGVSDAALTDLVRAAAMYTSARTSAPIPELPAVIAAVVALNLGDTATARAVVDEAIAGGHGGGWARRRLLLWRAWIAVQRVRPRDAQRAIAEADRERLPASPRDELLARSVAVALARRYGDAADLSEAWQRAHAALIRVDVDAFLFLPVAELVCAAAKAGDPDRAAEALAHALDTAAGLDSAPLWTAHVRWAGVQRSILIGRPDELIPHAHALVAAGRGSAVSAAMAAAGRVWTSVLAGTVDAEAVEAAAQSLASFGLAWDAARLSGHGAARCADRRISARLLARARELHPIELEQRSTAEPAPGADGATESSAAHEVLSEREREVARLVLQGKTYAEIGEAIFISPRTAEHHIAHIRRRLGATSRSDVIAKLRLLMAEPAPAGDTGAEGASTEPHPHPVT